MCSVDVLLYNAKRYTDNAPSFWHKLQEEGVKYWQHGETGNCCAVDDNIVLSRRHFEITKEQYDLHECAKNTEQQVQVDKSGKCDYPKAFIICKWFESGLCKSPDGICKAT